MTSAANRVRQQVEEAMASRGGAGRVLSPQLIQKGLASGCDTLDAILQCGFPIAGTTEIVGSRSSGRATLAAAYLAQRTREGQVCAWIDVSNDMDPNSFITNGGDLNRVLWVRCSGDTEPTPERPNTTPGKADLQVVSYGRDKTLGTPGVKNRVLGEVEVRVVQVSSDRLPKRRGELVLKKSTAKVQQPVTPSFVTSSGEISKRKKPWGRLEQAIKAVDLLVQGGGFGTIVMDMGGIQPEFARKIPLATWFRWRAALERTRTSLLVLSQSGCAGSSAEMMIRTEAEIPESGTVMLGVSYRLEVIRRRFEEVEGQRKRVSRASVWESRPGWVSYG